MAIDGCAKAGEVRATAMTVASASRFMAFSTATGASFIANITLMEFRAQRPACGGQYAADRWPHIASIRRAARSALIASISALAPARSPISAVNSRRVMSDMGLPPKRDHQQPTDLTDRRIGEKHPS